MRVIRTWRNGTPPRQVPQHRPSDFTTTSVASGSPMQPAPRRTCCVETRRIGSWITRWSTKAEPCILVSTLLNRGPLALLNLGRTVSQLRTARNRAMRTRGSGHPHEMNLSAVKAAHCPSVITPIAKGTARSFTTRHALYVYTPSGRSTYRRIRILHSSTKSIAWRTRLRGRAARARPRVRRDLGTRQPSLA